MKEAGFIKAERNLKSLLRFWMAFFSISAIFLIFMPKTALDYFTKLGWTFLSIPIPQTSGDNFYWILSIGYLVTLTYICLMAQSDIIRKINLVPVLIIAKFSTCLGFTILTFSKMNFLYLSGAIIDGLICILTWYYYSRSLHGRQ